MEERKTEEEEDGKKMQRSLKKQVGTTPYEKEESYSLGSGIVVQCSTLRPDVLKKPLQPKGLLTYKQMYHQISRTVVSYI